MPGDQRDGSGSTSSAKHMIRDRRKRFFRLAATGTAMVLAGAYAWWATSLRPFTSAALGATAAASAAAVVAGLRREGPQEGRRRDQRRGGTGAWLVLVGALGAWELVSFLQHPRADHPTLSSLANSAFRSHAVRTLAMVVWMALGARAVRR